MNLSTFRNLLLLATAFSFTATHATGPADPLRIHAPSAQERELMKQIDQHVTYPLLEREPVADGEVLVSFVINAAGKVEVISATSDNATLRAYVLRKLDRIDIGDNPSGTWKTEHVRFVFRPEA